MPLYKTGQETGQYILENFPFQIATGFRLYHKASDWIESETDWVHLVRSFTYASDGSVLYQLNDDSDYVRWMMSGTGIPILYFRHEKHAIWFKLNWSGEEDDGEDRV